MIKRLRIFRSVIAEVQRSLRKAEVRVSYRPRWWIALVAVVWPLSHIGARAYRVPVVGRALTWLTLPLFSPKRQSLTYVPINEKVARADSVPVPRVIVADLIEKSSHHTIIRQCTCRLEKGCADHNTDIGCMLMGDGAAEIDGKIARHVTKAQALAHLDRALADGLMPLVGRAPIDNYIWGVRNRGRLLTVCFCCRCCCTILDAGRHLPGEIHRSIVRLEGVSIETDQGGCTLCGTCVRECFMGALSIADGALSRDEALCKGCGRCAAVCPAGAITVSADASAARKGILSRIRGFVDFEKRKEPR